MIIRSEGGEHRARPTLPSQCTLRRDRAFAPAQCPCLSCLSPAAGCHLPERAPTRQALQQQTGAGRRDADRGHTPVGTEHSRPHGHLERPRDASGESGPRGAARARRSVAPHRPTRPACTTCRRPDISTCMPRSSEHTRVPGTPRAAGPRVAGTRAPPRGSARLAHRHAVSAHQVAAPQPGRGQPACSASLLPLQTLMRRFSIAHAPPILRARPSRPRKIDVTIAISRPSARAPVAHCCTLMTAEVSERCPWSACKAARSGGARTAFPGQVAPRGSDSPIFTPWRTRRLGHGAGPRTAPYRPRSFLTGSVSRRCECA